ncbi:MAG: ATP-binding cassette domain-containing protein [Anaerolineae bacterium]|nr:ATP-binding cassette domain-containing protein [Anaerolineae bacterium]
MLVVSNISKRFPGADEPVLKNITFTVNAGERVGLIGPNGSGKSTLIQIIMGNLPSESGSVQFSPPTLRVGYLAQGLADADDMPIRAMLFPQTSALHQAEADLERLAIALGENPDDPQTAEAYGEALERLMQLSQQIDTNEAERILAGLDLAGVDLDAPVGTLSGGQKTRLGLSALLLSQPDLLILDEPTNHLDVTGIEWLEGWLNDFDGGVLVVSHDRTFLDEIVTSVVALDAVNHTARVFENCNYSEYVAAVKSEWDKQWAQWRDQQVEIVRLQADVERTMARAVRKENATKNDQQRRYAKKVAKRAKAKETRLHRYLDDDERVEKPERTWPLRLDNLALVDAIPTGREVITLTDVSVGYDQPLLTNLNLTLLAGERIAVLGPNGQGKSTLLKTIIGDLPPLAGQVRIASSAKIGYLAQEQENLDPASNPLKTLLDAVAMTETEARTFLHFFLFKGDDVFTPVHQLSYGERACLILAVLVARGANLLVLDEPINHLDVPARERFEEAMGVFQGSVLAVVHDRYFVDKFATKVWHVADGELTEEVRQVLAEI